MTVTIEQETATGFTFDYEELAQEVVTSAIDAEQFPYEAEVNILLVSAEVIQDLNNTHRQTDCVTDVLSFPMIHYQRAGDFSRLEQDDNNFNPDTGEALIGDIVLCVQMVKEQAARFGHSEKREFAFLILHSMLHLFGYDHMSEKEAAVMETKQTLILEHMGILR